MLAVRVCCEMHTVCCTPYWARVCVASEEAKPETGQNGGKTVIHSVMLEWTTDCIAVQHYDASKVSILACLLLFHTNHHDNPLTLAARIHLPSPFIHPPHLPLDLSLLICRYFLLGTTSACPLCFPQLTDGWCDVTVQAVKHLRSLNMCHFQGAKWIQKYLYCSTLLNVQKMLSANLRMSKP